MLEIANVSLNKQSVDIRVCLKRSMVGQSGFQICRPDFFNQREEIEKINTMERRTRQWKSMKPWKSK